MKARKSSWRGLVDRLTGTEPAFPPTTDQKNQTELRDEINRLATENSRLLAEIAAQEKTQATLEANKALLSDLASAASDWIWMLDEQLRFSYLSDRFDEMAASIPSNAPREALGKTRWEVAGADPDQDEMWREHRACLEARKPFRDFRYSFVGSKGDREYFRASGVPYFDAAGKFLGYRGTANRETEEVLIRQKASELEQSYREIYENAVVGIFRATAEGEFVQANPALYRLFNFDSESEFLQAVNTAPEDLFPEPVLRIAIKQEIQKRGVIDAFETELRNKSHDKRVWVSISAGEVRDEEGRLKYFEGMIQDVTKRKNAEAVLRRRERELAQAQRIGRSGHWRWFIDEGVIECSEEMCRLLCLPTDKTRFPKNEGDQFIHPQDLPAFRKREKHAIRQRSPYKSEHRVLLPDGEIRHHASEGHPEFDTEGRIISIFGINRDITEQRAVEEALRDSERQLNDAQRLGHMGHWRYDIQLETTRWSDELWRIFGLEPEDRCLTLDEMFDKVLEEDRERVRAERREAWAQGRHFVQSYRVVRPNGDIRYIKVEGHPQADDSGQPIAYFGVTQDVTDRTLANAALKESEARNRAIVEALSRAKVGLSITTDARGFIDANDAVVEFAGFSSKEQIIGRKLADMQHHGYADYAELGREMYQSIATKGSWAGEFDWRRPDGEEINLGVRSAPFVDDAIIHIVADVTEQKRRERREAELEEGLKQSQKMEALGQMAGGIAHEINNLLHPIINFTKLSQNQVTDEKIQHYLARSLECGRKAAEIVSDILTFARKGSGERKAVDLVELTERTVRFAQDVTPLDIVIRVKTIDGSATAEVNETEFIQVILNLVQNANDAMAGVGEIRLEIDRAQVESALAAKLGLVEGCYVRVAVIDRGQGIPDQILDHIFEPFFTTKEVGRGTGLGLAVVYGIVKGWNGAISVESKKGEGARFDVYIPLIPDAVAGLEIEGI